MNIGIIGAGAFMSRQHLPNIVRDPRYRLHTLCDLDRDRIAAVAREFPPQKTTADAEEALADPELDVVLIGTRSRLHAGFLKQAIAHGKHVYVEKPMTMTVEETRDVLQAARGNRVTVGVGFNRRFAPALVEAKRRFQSFRNGPANLIYRIVDDHEIRPAYIFDMNEGGGHLLQEGCHIFDLLAWFLDREPVEVYAAGPLETDNLLILKFDDGSIATLVCGGKGGAFYPKECLELFCGRTTLALDHFYELRIDGPGGNLIQRFPLDPKSRTEPPAATMTGFYEAQFGMRPARDLVGAHAANSFFTLGPDKGHSQALAAFCDCVASGTPYAPGVVDGARATLLALKAYESIRANRPVAIRREEYEL